MKKRICFWTVLCAVLLSGACKKAESNIEKPLFEQLSASKTGIDFANTLVFNEDFNVYKYRNYYNGGGVAIGDINNDGLADVYLTANSLPNKLFLNKGNFEFVDITTQAGVAGKKQWSTGVTMADVNGDGFLDLYVCNSGDVAGDGRENELFLNKGNGTFEEAAALRGLADKGYSTHSVFFDYDKDGDLDCYLLNNSFTSINSFNKRNNLRNVRDTLGGHKLFRNKGQGYFEDVSQAAGIFGSVIAFGLGVQVGDMDRDGWDDIYVSNDFFERDYLYINQKNGTFKEDLPARMRHISAASMGADLADINNDAYPDLFATDMLPRDERRLKTKTTFDSWNNYKYEGEDNGYGRQFTRNMLQVNNGDGTFAELACFAGVEATDWSWGALIFDMDLDGHKDLFVSNGILGDLTDQDYVQFISDSKTKQELATAKGVNYKKLIETIPSEPLSNFAFRNNGNLTFTDMANTWGLAEKGFNNGAAYGDLDNDGDLDLIVNRVNMPCAVYKNEAQKLKKQNHYLQFQLKGKGENPFAVGTKITAKCKNNLFFVENLPARGFQSTVDARPHLGVSVFETIDSLWIEWPDLEVSLLTNVKVNQMLQLDYALVPHSKSIKVSKKECRTVAKMANATVAMGLADLWQHKENLYSDFDAERLIYLMRSADGPKLAVADVNADGLEDVYVGGARFQAGQLLLQQRNGQFSRSVQPDFEKDSICEDSQAMFFDMDGDGDQDLYVGSGGSEATPNTAALGDRIYENKNGSFVRKMNALPPTKPFATGSVAAADYDGDGDLDLLVGMRMHPGRHGLPCSSFLMQNQGKGDFKNVMIQAAPLLSEIGMVCDSYFGDIDGDKDADIVLVGEYMPIKILLNQNEKFTAPENSALDFSHGWWSSLTSADLDADGDLDFVVGNYGLNSRFHATEKEPLSLFFNDFDKNETPEAVLSQFYAGKAYPLALRHDLVSQMPALKKKYIRYDSYALQTLQDIFKPEDIAAAKTYHCHTLQSAVLWNEGKGQFTVTPLPAQAQWAPIFGIVVADVTADGQPDILCGGNFSYAKPEIGATDANYGLVLENMGQRKFSPLSYLETGFALSGDVRDMVLLTTPFGPRVLVAVNNSGLQAFGF